MTAADPPPGAGLLAGEGASLLATVTGLLALVGSTPVQVLWLLVVAGAALARAVMVRDRAGGTAPRREGDADA